jgi:hypothetical protein
MKFNLFQFSIWGLFLAVIFPIAGLAYYNHPSVADDYCFAYMTRDYGFWAGQKFYYDGWSGRYFTNMLFHATPLAYGHFWFVKVMPFVILGFMLHANYHFWKEIFPQFSTKIQLGITLSFNALFILQMPSLVDEFYWYTSVFIFPISMVYLQYLIVVILRFYQDKYQKIKYLIGILACALVFFIIGSNEMMMLFLLCFLGAVFGYLLLFERQFNPLFLCLILVGISSACLVVFSPGNTVRMNGDGMLDAGLDRALLSTLNSVISEITHWILSFPVLIFSLILGYFLKEYQGNFPKFFRVNIFISLLIWVGLMAVMFFMIHYGNNMGVPGRVANSIYEVFLLGWIFHLILLQEKWRVFDKIFLPWLVSSSDIHASAHTVADAQVSGGDTSHGGRDTSHGRKKTLITLISISLLAICFIFSTNMKTAYKELLKGTAEGYDQEMLARYEYIRTAKSDTIYISPLEHKPTTLYFDEIKNTEKHLWNRCYATYFGKKVIILKEN